MYNSDVPNIMSGIICYFIVMVPYRLSPCSRAISMIFFDSASWNLLHSAKMKLHIIIACVAIDLPFPRFHTSVGIALAASLIQVASLYSATILLILKEVISQQRNQILHISAGQSYVVVPVLLHTTLINSVKK